MIYALAVPVRLDLESFAHSAGMHPDLVRRLVTLGLLEATPGPADRLWFSPAQLAAAARIQRLHTGLALNYAAIGVVTQLLDRIAVLEAALSDRSRLTGGQPWT